VVPPVPIVNFWASPLGAAAAVVSAAAAVVSAAGAAVVSAGLLPPEQAVSTIAQDNASAIAAENLFLISFYLLFSVPLHNVSAKEAYEHIIQRPHYFCNKFYKFLQTSEILLFFFVFS